MRSRQHRNRPTQHRNRPNKISPAIALLSIVLTGCEGEVGPQGHQGDQGEIGPQGDQGDQGEKGNQGDKGDKGDKGDVGPQGPVGSISSVYCGKTATSNGNLGGYAAAKALCETACGDADAHMCTASEMVISAQRALLPNESLWYGSGVLTASFELWGDLTSNTVSYDCKGWRLALAARFGAMWRGNTDGDGDSYASSCDTELAVACCL